MKKMLKAAAVLAAMVMALTLGACDNGSSSGSGGGDGDGSGSSGGGSKSSYLKIEGNKVTGVHLNKIPSDGKIVIPDGVEELTGDWVLDLDVFGEDDYSLTSDKVTSISLPASLKHTRNVIPYSWTDYGVQTQALDIDIIYRGTLSDFCKTENGSSGFQYAKSIKVGDDDLKTLEALVIPDGVTEIANYAFGYLPNITSVTIPASVKKIGDYAFFLPVVNSNIEAVTYKGRLKDWCDIIINDFLSVCAMQSIKMSDGKDLKTLTKITADDIAGATKIGDYAFADCNALTDVVIPESVTKIGEGAFFSCSALESVTFKITDGWHEGKYDSKEDVSDAASNAYALKGHSGQLHHPGLYRETE